MANLDLFGRRKHSFGDVHDSETGISDDGINVFLRFRWTTELQDDRWTKTAGMRYLFMKRATL